jgi:hypothetical protein
MGASGKLRERARFSKGRPGSMASEPTAADTVAGPDRAGLWKLSHGLCRSPVRSGQGMGGAALRFPGEYYGEDWLCRLTRMKGSISK